MNKNMGHRSPTQHTRSHGFVGCGGRGLHRLATTHEDATPRSGVLY